MIFATHQTYNQYLCKGKVRAQEMIFTSHQTYYQLVVLQRKSKGNDFCYPSNLLPVVLQRKKKRVQEMISATHQTYYQWLCKSPAYGSFFEILSASKPGIQFDAFFLSSITFEALC